MNDCHVCLKGFKEFADHAQCDGCFQPVHFRQCSNYRIIERGEDEHLYIFCFDCNVDEDLTDSTYEDEDGYFHPKDADTSILDTIDWSDLDDEDEE